MDDRLHFLCSNGLDGLAEAHCDGRGVVEHGEAFLRGTADRTGIDPRVILAVPVVSGGEAAGARSVSWYTPHEGLAVRWADLDGAAREQTIADIRAVFASLAPLLGDPEAGPIIARALNVADARRDIHLVGGRHPVIVNWGLVPEAAGADETGRRAHFAVGIGAMLPGFALPPFHSGDPLGEMPESLAPTERTEAAMPAEHPAAAEEPVIAPGAALAAPVRAAPAWRTPAIACAAMALLLLLLVLLPRFNVWNRALAWPAAGSGAIGETITLLNARAGALRRGLDADPCSVPDAVLP